MLTPCPDCGKRISSMAEVCPRCGYPLCMGVVDGEDALRRVERIVFGSLDGRPVEWKVVRIDSCEGLAMVVSECVLARRPYSLAGDTGWHGSDLAAWIKDSFSYELFSSKERGFVAGSPFVPTARQAAEFWSSDCVRRAWSQSNLAVGDGFAGARGPLSWWLSTPSEDGSKVQYVRPDGRVYEPGADPREELGVRLAMWIEPRTSVCRG